jgi:catechol 2,3-dioxygenase-like lactoylglutathione lyase family enzyme
MQISRLIPQLRTRDLDGSIRFYTEMVGFALEFRYSDFYAGIRVGSQLFHLKQVDAADPSIAFVEAGGHLHLYLETPDVEAVAQRLKANGVSLRQEPSDTDWQTRELSFVDDQGHTIYVGQGRDVRSVKRHSGSCHCGAVRFEMESDFPELTMCDCSICKRKNALMVKVHISKFSLLSGEDALIAYQFHTHTATHYFCKVCGIYPFHRKRVTPDYYGINVHCLHDFDPAGIPVRQTIGALMP